MRPVLSLFAATCCGLGLTAAQEESKFTPERLEGFREDLQLTLKINRIPGLGAVLVTRDRVVWAGGVGVADTNSKQPVTDGTLFRIGSISKSFVALSAMMLVEEAKLDLQTPLRELAPEIRFQNRWEETHPVRVVHLMEHTTGWDDLAMREYAHDVDPPISLRKGLVFDPRSRTSRWPPGRSMSYCNSGPAVAAYVIQELAEMDFQEFVRERIFDPLNMPLATFRPEGEARERLASGYRDGERVDYWNILQRPSGAVSTTPREMANYLRMYLNEGELDGVRLVKPESIDRMMEARTPRAVRAGVEEWYGLGIARYASAGQVWYGHTGRLPGYVADMAWCPKLGVGYAIMINSSSGGFNQLRSEFREFIVQGQEPDELPRVATLRPKELAAHEGYYQLITPRREEGRYLAPFLNVVRVKAQGGSLWLTTMNTTEDPKEFLPVTEHLFRSPKDQLSSLVFYEGEEEGQARFSIREEYQRVSQPLVWAAWVLGEAALVLMASTVFFALIWLPRLLFGRRLREEPFLVARVLPFLCTLFFAASVGLHLMGVRQDVIASFGTPTFWSIGVFVATIMFALTAMAGLCVTLIAKRSTINRAVRWHALLVSGAQVTVALYLASWGVIGLRSWA
ncbi:MAG: serine hydrolase domain-containing protein [Roseibacillus sp.]